MKLLDRLVLKELIPVFWQSVALFTVLVFAAGPLSEAMIYIAQGVSPGIILALVGLKLPWVLGLTFPMGTLLAMLIGYGRLSDESEAVALFAGGIPFARIAAPAAALGLMASLVGFIINDKITAEANSRVAAIQEHVLHEPGETSRAFDFEDRSQGRLRAMAHVEKGFDAHTKSMRQVIITFYGGKDENPTVIIYAERGQWRGGQDWHLFNVSALTPTTGVTVHSGGMDSGDLKSPILSKSPDEIAMLASKMDTLDFHQLYRRITRLKAGGMGGDPKLREAEFALWSKMALPIASLVFALIGAPLGLRAQRSAKQTSWMLAILIIFCYYVLYMLMRSLADGGYCAPVLAVFLPNLIGLFGGAFLIRKATRAVQ